MCVMVFNSMRDRPVMRKQKEIQATIFSTLESFMNICVFVCIYVSVWCVIIVI